MVSVADEWQFPAAAVAQPSALTIQSLLVDLKRINTDVLVQENDQRPQTTNHRPKNSGILPITGRFTCQGARSVTKSDGRLILSLKENCVCVCVCVCV